MDNYGTHKTPKVKRWLQRHPEYRLHFIPTSSSWLNQVERFFAEITEKRIRRGAFRSVKALEQAIMITGPSQRQPKAFCVSATATRFWDASPEFVNEFLTQDTRVGVQENNAVPVTSLNACLRWPDVASALDIPGSSATQPIRTGCKLCTSSRFHVFEDTIYGGYWYDCKECHSRGDLIPWRPRSGNALLMRRSSAWQAPVARSLRRFWTLAPSVHTCSITWSGTTLPRFSGRRHKTTWQRTETAEQPATRSHCLICSNGFN